MKKIKILLNFFSLLGFLALPTILKAQTLISNPEIGENANDFAAELGFSSASLGSIVALLIKSALSLLGLIFLVLIISSGFKWMTAQDNSNDVEKAKTTLKNAIIGLVIVLSAYAITYFVFNTLSFSGGGSGAVAVPG